MNLIYDAYARIYDRELSYNDTSSSTVMIYYQKKDYTLRVQFNGNSTETIMGHGQDIKSIVITCLLPDNTEYNVQIDDTLIIRPNNMPDGYFTSWFGIINNNSILTSQIGLCKLLIRLYGENNTLMGSGRANLNIVSSDTVSYKLIDHFLDVWALATPTIVRLNQYDENIQLRFRIMHSRAILSRPSTSGSTYFKYYLEGRTKSGNVISIVGTETYQVSQGQASAWYCTFTIPKELTSELGPTTLQIRMERSWYNSAINGFLYKNLYSSKIILHIEPKP